MATPVISRLVPIPRNQGIQIPGVLNTATWIDARVLAAGVAESYTLPTDAQTPAQHATLLRINANAGPIFVNFNGTAAVPGADVTNGTSSIMLRTDLGPVLLAAPHATDTLSIISPSACIVTIEAWS